MRFDAVSIGHVTVDDIRLPTKHKISRSPVPGGSALYFAVVFAQLGMRVALVSRIGNDWATKIIDFLNERNVNCELLKIVKDDTTRVEVTYSKDLSKKVKVKKGASYKLQLKDISKEAFNARIVHIASAFGQTINQSVKLQAEIISRARQEGAFVAFDPQEEYNIVPLQRLDRILKHTSFIHMNEKQLFNITRLFSIKSAVMAIAERGPKVVIITKGKKGAEIFSSETLIRIPAIVAQNIDPTGAGDAFFAGFLWDYLKNRDLRSAGYVGSAVASLILEDVGPYKLFSKNDVEARLSLLKNFDLS
jgi:sugar/nucleoside kinase (ribokinase family)